MDIQTFAIPGPVLLTPCRHVDARGHFSETYNRDQLADIVGPVDFVQDNESLSARAGTVRGLHAQASPHAQGKLVRCAVGAVIDVAVDVRRNSPTFAQHVRVALSADTGQQLWIPPGFLHGFATQMDDTVFLYKVTDRYAPEVDHTVRWDDTELDIDWGVGRKRATVSDKDRAGIRFADWSSPFIWEGPS